MPKILDYRSKAILEDMVDRGYFKNIKEAIASAVRALQSKMADEALTDEYFDNESAQEMADLQLKNIR